MTYEQEINIVFELLEIFKSTVAKGVDERYFDEVKEDLEGAFYHKYTEGMSVEDILEMYIDEEKANEKTERMNEILDRHNKRLQILIALKAFYRPTLKLEKLNRGESING